MILLALSCFESISFKGVLLKGLFETYPNIFTVVVEPFKIFQICFTKQNFLKVLYCHHKVTIQVSILITGFLEELVNNVLCNLVYVNAVVASTWCIRLLFANIGTLKFTFNVVIIVITPESRQ